MLGILDDADDFKFTALFCTETEALPNRVFFAEVVAGESFAHDPDLLIAFPVKISRHKAASAQNRHAGSFKILRPDAVNKLISARASLAERGRRPSLDMQSALIERPSFAKQPPSQARGAHARNRFEAFE